MGHRGSQKISRESGEGDFSAVLCLEEGPRREEVKTPRCSSPQWKKAMKDVSARGKWKKLQSPVTNHLFPDFFPGGNPGIFGFVHHPV